MTDFSRSATYAKDEADYQTSRQRGEDVVLAAGVNLPVVVKPVVTDLRRLAHLIESVNALNPFMSIVQLRRYRSQYMREQPDQEALLENCVASLARPVEGKTSMDFAYIQAMHLSGGLAAITALQSAMKLVAETLDRKIAYAVAGASMYVALASLLATLVLGVMSLR